MAESKKEKKALRKLRLTVMRIIRFKNYCEPREEKIAAHFRQRRESARPCLITHTRRDRLTVFSLCLGRDVQDTRNLKEF